jgi:arylsulfatase A-like enzyme
MLMFPRRQLILLFSAVLVTAAAGAWWMMQPDPGQAVVSSAGNTARQQKTSEGPDVPVIIYLVDTLRADRLGLYGYDQHVTSWRIDALAAESVVFDRAYAPAPWTLPSVTSLITSTFACEHLMLESLKTQEERLTAVGPGPALKTLAERLGSIGFLTGGFYVNTVVGKSSGLHRGYDEYVLRTSFVSEVQRMQDVQAFLNRAGSRPFLLYVHTMEPHRITATPKRYIERIGDIDMAVRRPIGTSTLKYSGLRHADWKLGKPLGTTDNTAEQQQLFSYLEGVQESIEILYDAAVLRADANLGDLLQVLRDRGLWDKAIFIFLSDHGEEFNDHGGWFHAQSVYEELMRVPLIIHFPHGEFGGRRIDAPVSLVDIMPTIFAYLERPGLCDGCRGVSLLPLLRESPGAANTEISVPGLRINPVNYYRPWKESRGDVNVVVRQGPWKGIWNDELSTLELYNLEADPKELMNVSVEHPGLERELGDRARAWLKDCWAQAKQPEELGEVDEETQERLRALGYFN